MMMASFFYGSTQYPKPMSTLLHNSQNLLVSIRHTAVKRHGLHDIKADILISKMVSLGFHD